MMTKILREKEYKRQGEGRKIKRKDKGHERKVEDRNFHSSK